MERIIRSFDSYSAADEAVRQDDNLLDCQQRFAAFMQLMEPVYEDAPGFQRVYRVDDFQQRTVRDDWGLCVQFISESKIDR
ncbi:MAG: hypothetical protein NXI32_05705 [bacterium]|nr:hypothetical protein [bacterium]